MPLKTDIDNLIKWMKSNSLWSEGFKPSPHLEAEFFPRLRYLIERNIKPPDINDNCVVAPGREKMAALCYDKVWDLSGIIVPDSLRFSANTSAEFNAIAQWLYFEAAAPNFYIHPILGTAMSSFGTEPNIYLHANIISRNMADDISKTAATPVIPIYRTIEDREKEYSPGSSATIIGVLSNLAVVKEEKLAWEQVKQFRSDTEARCKYQRFLHWLDKDMVGKSQAFIEEEIAHRMEDYQWAIKKHGIETVIGGITTTFDAKAILAWAGAIGIGVLAEHPVLGFIAAGIHFSGKVVASLTQAYLDLKDVKCGPYSEVAVVYEIQKLMKK